MKRGWKLRDHEINHFEADTEAEISEIINFTKKLGIEGILCKHWSNGSDGASELANKVVEISEKSHSPFKFLYEDNQPLIEKINLIAKKIYRADGISVDEKILDQLSRWENSGFGSLPICMAKTQYSFSSNPKLLGAPKEFQIPIKEVRLHSGAGFIVVICGEIMTMPGLPKKPAAEEILINQNGKVEGLF